MHGIATDDIPLTLAFVESLHCQMIGNVSYNCNCGTQHASSLY